MCARVCMRSLSKANDAQQLAPCFSDSQFSRCHGRFVIPVILLGTTNICRSGTVSVFGETLFRNTKSFVGSAVEMVGSAVSSIGKLASWWPPPSSDPPSPFADPSITPAATAPTTPTITTTTTTTRDEMILSGRMGPTKISSAMAAEVPQDDGRVSGSPTPAIGSLGPGAADELVLSLLRVRIIADLMVEHQKTKYGCYVSSSERVERRHGRYAEPAFHIYGMPYPGCEFFRAFHDNGHAAPGLKFDWTQSEVTSSLSTPFTVFRRPPSRAEPSTPSLLTSTLTNYGTSTSQWLPHLNPGKTGKKLLDPAVEEKEGALREAGRAMRVDRIGDGRPAFASSEVIVLRKETSIVSDVRGARPAEFIDASVAGAGAGAGNAAYAASIHPPAQRPLELDGGAGEAIAIRETARPAHLAPTHPTPTHSRTQCSSSLDTDADPWMDYQQWDLVELTQAYLQLLLARVTTNSLDDPNLLREALKDRGVNAVPASEPSDPDPFTSADPRSLSARRGPNEERTVLQRPGPGPGPGEAAASSDEGSTSRSSSRSTYHHARGSAGPGLLVLQRCTDKIQIRQRHTSPFASRLCPRPILCHSLFAAAD